MHGRRVERKGEDRREIARAFDRIAGKTPRSHWLACRVSCRNQKRPYRHCSHRKDCSMSSSSEAEGTEKVIDNHSNKRDGDNRAECYPYHFP